MIAGLDKIPRQFSNLKYRLMADTHLSQVPGIEGFGGRAAVGSCGGRWSAGQSERLCGTLTTLITNSGG